MKQLLLLILLITFAAVADPAMTDCKETLTKEYQNWLLTNYPLLHDNYVHTTNLKIGAASMKPGTVIFLNAQDKNFQMTCPKECGGKDAKWTLSNSPTTNYSDKARKEAYEEVSGLDSYSADDEGVIRPRTPSPRLYFRTYTCSKGEKFHHFNVFTRPLPKATFPVQWIEDYGFDTVRKKELTFTCIVEGHEEVIFRKGPYRFSWKANANKMKKVVNVPIKEGVTHVEEDYKLKFSSKLVSPYAEDKSSPIAIVNATDLTAHMDSAGEYICVVHDRNDLSSDYSKVKGQLPKGFCCTKPPDRIRFNGMVVVHVRGKNMVYVPLVCIGGGAVIFVLLICLCPDHTDGIEEEKKMKKKEVIGGPTKDISAIPPSVPAASATQADVAALPQIRKSTLKTDSPLQNPSEDHTEALAKAESTTKSHKKRKKHVE